MSHQELVKTLQEKSEQQVIDVPEAAELDQYSLIEGFTHIPTG